MYSEGTITKTEGKDDMNKDLDKFRTLFLTDAQFRTRLQDAMSSYNEDQTEEAIFSNILVPIAAEYGISATFTEFKEYMDGLQSAEMSKEELSQVAGGKEEINAGGAGAGICYVIGAGVGTATGKNYGTACSFIGLGWGTTYCAGIGNAEDI